MRITNKIKVEVSSRPKFLDRIQTTQTFALTATFVLIFIFFSCLNSLYFTSLLPIFALLFAFPKVFLRFFEKFHNFFFRSSKLNSLLVLGLLLGILIGVSLSVTPDPAHAQFFKSTETWMGNVFKPTGNASAANTNVIALIFNVLRGLFVIYLGIALVRVIQSARNDDDWQQLARTPLIIVVAVTIGDVLANIITGTAST